jgi:arylsulfatase A
VVSKRISKRAFLKTAAAAAIAPAASRFSLSVRAMPSRPPSVVLICADDLGSGDLSFTRSPSITRRQMPARDLGNTAPAPDPTCIRTPNLDLLASEGVRLTQFNAASPVCSPSRAAMLTGRYPARMGVPDVLFPSDKIGLPVTETTIASMLKPLGYKTVCVGKWHLGSQTQFLPTNHGFDEFFGLPYSHDMSPLPLMHDCEVIEAQADVATLTPRCTQRAVQFIAESKGAPFFLYMAHFLPHIPLISSAQFRGKSPCGPYGDAVEEIDWSVGQILDTLREHGLDQNTFVMFTSDHGPWYQGSAGHLRGHKGETLEGGVRVPFIARFPGQIPQHQVNRGIASNLDILPTVARITGARLPGEPLDGTDIWPLLSGAAQEINREVLLYFDGWHLQCAKLGQWKLHVARYNSVVWGPAPAGGRLNLPLPKPELYDLESDPTESYDVAEANPEVVAAIQARLRALLPTFPEQVRSAWETTQSLKVENTPSGALPVLKSH